MQSFRSTHLPDENGTPYAHAHRTQGAGSFYKSAMPPAERDHPLRGVRQTSPVEPDGQRDGRATILSIGDDPDLLRTRHLVLESAGYEVHSFSGNALVQDNVITVADLAIICHSVRELQTTAIIRALRKVSPSIPIVLLTTAFVRRPSIGDEIAVLSVSDGPQTLLTQIHSMLSALRKSAGSQA